MSPKYTITIYLIIELISFSFLESLFPFELGVEKIISCNPIRLEKIYISIFFLKKLACIACQMATSHFINTILYISL
jgi:hypothetical protein